MTSPPIEYKVPRILWESLESVLLAQSRKYIGELARHLCVSEKELIKQVLPSNDTLKIYIQDSKSETNQCKAYTQKDNMTIYCRHPTAYGSEYCCLHHTKRMMLIKEIEPEHIEKIKDRNDLPPIWKKKDNSIINSHGNIIGKLNNKDGFIKIFVLPK